jgi:hypothetical protein
VSAFQHHHRDRLQRLLINLNELNQANEINNAKRKQCHLSPAVTEAEEEQECEKEVSKKDISRA